MKNPYVIIFVVIALFFGTMFGLYIGALALLEKSNCLGGWEAARIKLIQEGHFTDYRTNLTGSIIEVKDNKIVFEAPLVNPLDDDSLKIRTVVIDEETDLTLKKLKSEEDYRRDSKEAEAQVEVLQPEFDIAEKALKECESSAPKSGCSNYYNEYIRLKMDIRNANLAGGRYEIIEDFKLSEIKPGYLIRAVSKSISMNGNNKEDRQNIALEKEFSASLVEIMENFVSPDKK